MSATIIVPDFRGNRPRVACDLDEPCVVIILPYVAVDRGLLYERALKRYSRKRKLPKVAE